MTFAPQSLLEVRDYLTQVTGLPLVSLGIVGGPNHNGGYHCGWDRRRIVSGKVADYSFLESDRDRHSRSHAASAIDIGNFPGLREFSRWVAQECSNGVVDTRNIREIIYSPDGVRVLRWDRLRIRSTGDDSHLWHTHISFHRDTVETRSHLPLFKRFFEPEGSSMTPDEFMSLRPDLTNPDGTLHSTGQIVGHPSVSMNLALAGGIAAHYGIIRSVMPTLIRLEERLDALTEMVTQLAGSAPVSDEQLAVMVTALREAVADSALDPRLRLVLAAAGDELSKLDDPDE